MNSLVVDTNIFLRFLLKDNSRQFEQARTILQNAKDDKLKLIVPQIVIFEIAFTLEKYYKFPKNKIIEGIEAIVTNQHLKIQSQATFKNALTFYSRHNVSLVDCFLVAYSKENSAEIFTFDKNLQNLAK